MTTTEEPTNQASQQPLAGQSVKQLPEPLSQRNRNRVLKLSSSYRNPMVKHEPELHITTRRHRCCTLLLYSGLSQFLRVAKVALTRVEPRGLEPLTPCLQSKCATNCAMAPQPSPIPRKRPADPRSYVMAFAAPTPKSSLQPSCLQRAALSPLTKGPAGVRFCRHRDGVALIAESTYAVAHVVPA